MSNQLLSVGVLNCAMFVSLPAVADDTPPQDAAMVEIEKLKSKMAAMETRHDAEMTSLRNEHGDKWLSQQRAEEIRSIVKDVLADSETRASLADDGATSGYKNGFFVASADGNFKLLINGLIQGRAVYTYQSFQSRVASRQEESSEYGFEIRRAELVFTGNVVDPSWTYMVKVAFNQNGLVDQTNTSNITTTNTPALEDAFVRKDFGNGFAIRTGQWKSRYNIEESIGSKAQQFAERSIVNTYFKTDFIQGVELQYDSTNWRALINYNDGGGNRNIAAVGANTSGGGADVDHGNAVEWATAGRVDFKLAGEWKQFSEMMSFRGSGDGVMVGAGYQWQRGGALNLLNPAMVGNSPGMNISYTADLSVRSNGASFTAAFLGNSYYSRPDGLAPVDSYGALVQGGYFVTDDIELMARWEWMNVSGGTTNVATPSGTPPLAGHASAINAQHFSIYTIGANYYFSKNTIKFTGDVGYVDGALLFQNGIYGSNIVGADYRADETNDATGQVVARLQLQVYF